MPTDQVVYLGWIGILALDLRGHRFHGARNFHVIQVQGREPYSRVDDHAGQRENEEQSDESHAVLVVTHKTSLKEPLFNLISDPSPERSVTSIKIKPNSDRFTH